MSLSFLDPLFGAVAFVLVHIHSALAPIFGANSGASWALAIVLLTVGMRLCLFPLFVKQIRNQRAMQTIQPQMKELQTKYKNDKEKLNQEMMALWKESGANPLSGCLPLLLQIPIFIALFHTLRQIKPIPGLQPAEQPAVLPHRRAGLQPGEHLQRRAREDLRRSDLRRLHLLGQLHPRCRRLGQRDQDALSSCSRC